MRIKIGLLLVVLLHVLAYPVTPFASEVKSSFPNKGWKEYFSGDIESARSAWLNQTRGKRKSPLSSLGLAILSQSRGR